MDHIELIKGSDLKLKLKKKGILQQDIVKQFGYNVNTVSRYLSETNPMQMPASFLIKVAKLANLNIDDMIEGYSHSIGDSDASASVAASEPKVTYESPAKDISDKDDDNDYIKELVKIDATALAKVIDHLRKQIDEVEQSIRDLKKGKFIIPKQ